MTIDASIIEYIKPWIVPAIFIIGGAILFVIFEALSGYTDSKQVAASWRVLAEANKLTFVLGSFFGKKARIMGVYRNHKIEVSHYEIERQLVNENKPGTYTHIKVFSTKSSQQSKNKSFTENKDKLRPSGTLVDAKSLFLTIVSKKLKTDCLLTVEPNGRKISYHQQGLVVDIVYLQKIFDILVDIANIYPRVIELGSEIIPDLEMIVQDKRHLFKKLAIQLLYDIGKETTERLAADASELLCLRCGSRRCVAQKTKIDLLSSIVYYGCEICGQSREFIKSQLFAVLDTEMEANQLQQNEILRVNWLKHRKVFDFDRVEIIRVTDEDVERFAVQVGNDTDPLRQSRYKKMLCVVSEDCELSENTMRILRSMFGQVKQVRSGEQPILA